MRLALRPSGAPRLRVATLAGDTSPVTLATTTTATGGSAASQAVDLEHRAWTPRRWASWSIRAAVLLIPLLASIATTQVAASWIARPDDAVAFWIWMAGLAAVSMGTATAVHRLTKRLAPLGALFKMSLVFPDEAPSRFRAALRSGSSRSLARRPAGSGTMSSPEQAAAEELVALLGRLNRHDRLTRGHSERVRAYAVMLGEEIKLSRDDLDKLNWAALIHDIGKLEVPEAVLNKPGQPTDDEWRTLRTHPGASAPYVEPLRGWLGDWVDATTEHHERYDGRGYPRGLMGTEISQSGRIVAIADAFDVMTAARSYKKPIPPAQARAELLKNAGTQFDPHLVRSFLEVSLGRMRWIIGPLGWLTHLPDVIRAPLATVVTSSSGALVVGAVALAATTGVLATPDDVPSPPVAAVAEHPIGDPSPEATARPVVSIPPTTTPITAPPTNTPITAPPITAPPITAPPTTTPTPAVALVATAVDDVATGRAGKAISVHVLQNDAFGASSADSSSLAIVTAPGHGSATVTGSNVLYVPDADFVGTDSFEYTICSLLGACDRATVGVSISP